MKWEHDYKGSGMGKFFSDLGECIKHSWIHKRILIVDLIGEHNIEQNKDYYIRQEYWTDRPAYEFHRMGYRICEGLHDNLAWSGVTVLMRVYNFRVKEVLDPNFSRDTPSTLNDRMENNLLSKFAKSLARAQALAGMDLQKLILMGAIGIAAIIGMKMFGVF